VPCRLICNTFTPKFFLTGEQGQVIICQFGLIFHKNRIFMPIWLDNSGKTEKTGIWYGFFCFDG
jgi:hypothetical protein